MAEKPYAWIEFYTELADKLLPYRENHKALVEKVYQLYANTGIKMPKMDLNNELIDIDPFTVFGTFNKGLSDDGRKSIVTELKLLFDIKADAPTDFSGIPVLNNLNATFYRFKDTREEHDIDNLWTAFVAALAYADDGSKANRIAFINAFNNVKDLRGNRWKLTMGLYYVRPYSYINLDSRNRWFIEQPGRMPDSCVAITKGLNNIPDGETYLTICDTFATALKDGNYKYKSFPELSAEAWIVSEEINKKQKEEAKAKEGISNASFLRWFRPIIEALREIGGSGTPAEVREMIIKNEGVTEEELSETRGKTNTNKFKNEVAWARNYLVNGGYIDNSVKGIWTLTEEGFSVDMTDELASAIFKKAVNKQKRSQTENALGDGTTEEIHYWMYAAGQGSSLWDEFYRQGIMAIGWGDIGDLNQYSTKQEMKNAMKDTYGSGTSFKNAGLATWQFVKEMKSGDIVFVKRGQHEIVGRGIVLSDYRYDPDGEGEYKNIRDVDWTHNGKWPIQDQIVQKTLTDISQYTEVVADLNALFEEDGLTPDVPEVQYEPYDEEAFLEDVFMDLEHYHRLISVLKQKKNIILQGAPGVGKTYVAKRLAYSIMGVKDFSRVKMIQFHQSYSYEDFIMGFRPTENGFKLHTGAFYDFCKAAQDDKENEYFFIIDEINRGNISKIFGEVFMLIEEDKRGISLSLLYKNEQFSIPENMYIIGMMNTADRSLAMLDYALRRRFAFFDFTPAFGTDGFEKYRSSKNNTKFDKLIQTVMQLNDVIENDESLGDGFRIGHSYFVTDNEITDELLDSIVEYELIPLLKEYWFDEQTKVRDWSSNLRRAIK